VPIVLLDPFGKETTSEVFTEKFYNWVEQGGSRIVFVIGGAEGLPPELRSGSALDSHQKPILISLSQLTFTHQFARLVLIEQIYRASEIVSSWNEETISLFALARLRIFSSTTTKNPLASCKTVQRIWISQMSIIVWLFLVSILEGIRGYDLCFSTVVVRGASVFSIRPVFLEQFVLHQLVGGQQS